MMRLDYGSAVLAGIPSYLLNRLQFLLNTAARLVCRARKYVHVTQVRPCHSSAPGLALVTGSGKNTVPTGRTGFLLSQPQGAFVSHWRASLDWRGGITALTRVRLLSTVIVPWTRLSTIGDWLFRVTVARAWNSLPTSITAVTSLPSFKRQLQTFLFTKSSHQFNFSRCNLCTMS